MQIIEFDYNTVPTEFKNLNLCLGYFDGVHIGHQRIIEAAIKEGHEVGVLTLDSLPSFIVKKAPSEKSIMSIDDKASCLEKIGVKYLFVLAFNQSTAQLTRLDFINDILKKFEPNCLFAGPDYSFGREAKGTVDTLKEYFNVVVVDELHDLGKKVSSRTIRELITEGSIKEAVRLLGHPYRITGLVVQGNHIGQSLGYPTANMDLDFPYIMPKDGVYMGYAEIRGVMYKAMVSIGTHPSIQQLPLPIIEVHVLNYNGILYGDYLYLYLTDFIRDMMQFPNKEDLIVQLGKDKAYVEEHLK